jgi:hypothetical protein
VASRLTRPQTSTVPPHNGNGAAASSGNGSKDSVSATLDVRIALPHELWAWASDVAETVGQSLTDFVRCAVEREVDRHIRRGGADFVAMLEAARSSKRSPRATRSDA